MPVYLLHKIDSMSRGQLCWKLNNKGVQGQYIIMITKEFLHHIMIMYWKNSLCARQLFNSDSLISFLTLIPQQSDYNVVGKYTKYFSVIEWRIREWCFCHILRRMSVVAFKMFINQVIDLTYVFLTDWVYFYIYDT